jgi:hypothetical protein
MQWKNWRTGQGETVIGHEMRSGYSGLPVVAFQQRFDEVARQLSVGMSVQDVEGLPVGKIHQFDSAFGWLSVEKGVFGATLTLIPFTAIARIDSAKSTVLLLIRKDDLQKDLAALLPVPAEANTAQQPNINA